MNQSWKDVVVKFDVLLTTRGGRRRRTLGAEEGYDAQEYGKNLRDLNITPHIAPKQNSRTIDGRTTRHKTYQVSHRKRKRVEEIFGWAKTIGVIRKAKRKLTGFSG